MKGGGSTVPVGGVLVMCQGIARIVVASTVPVLPCFCCIVNFSDAEHASGPGNHIETLRCGCLEMKDSQMPKALVRN